MFKFHSHTFQSSMCGFDLLFENSVSDYLTNYIFQNLFCTILDSVCNRTRCLSKPSAKFILIYTLHIGSFFPKFIPYSRAHFINDFNHSQICSSFSFNNLDITLKFHQNLGNLEIIQNLLYHETVLFLYQIHVNNLSSMFLKFLPF